MSDTLIIVPTYNERNNIQPLLDSIFECLADTHVLFVDDGSPDGTGDLVDAICAKDERIHILHRTEKAGLGKAYIAGFKWALEREYEFIFEMDADLSHEAAALPRMRGAADTADLVLGSRYMNGIRVINWPLKRLILSMGAGKYVRLILGMPFSDPTGGFKCFRRSVLETIELDEVTSIGYSFQIELTYKAWTRGFKIVEEPITFTERTEGESKIHKGIVKEAILVVWKLLGGHGFKRSGAKTPHERSVEYKGGGTPDPT